MVITMAKLRMAHASTHGARKPPGPKYAASKSLYFSLYIHTFHLSSPPFICLEINYIIIRQTGISVELHKLNIKSC